jgi:hypothetical protein
MTLNNKRKRDMIEEEEEGVEESKEIVPMLSTSKDKTNPNEPMAFTCVCFEGKFYTTDDMGHFIHKRDEDMMHKLYRCEMENSTSEVKFVYIRSLNDTELSHFENVNDVNVVRDISSL